MWYNLGKFILKHRLPLLIILFAATGVMAYFASKVQLSYEFARAIPTDNPKLKEYEAFKARFGEDGNLIVIGVQTDSFYNVHSFNALKKLERNLKSVEGVEGILSTPDAITLLKNDSTSKLVASRIFPDTITLQQQIDSGRAVFENLPFYNGVLYNMQTNSYLVGVSVNKAIMNSKARTELVAKVVDKVKAFEEETKLDVHISGLPFIRTSIADKVKAEMKWFLIGSLVLSAITLLIFFRSFSSMFMSLLVVIMGVIWSLGTVGYKIFLPLIVAGFIFTSTFSQSQLQPVGQWREHLSYQNTIQVIQGGNEIFAATINNVFSVDDKNNITRYSKVTGLNDIGVSAIGYDDASQQLVIAYNNSNVDVVKNRIVRNISDILRSTVSGNKTINYIYCKDGIAYLCSGLGIIVVDLNRYEIKDTWQPGSSGQVNVNGFTSDGTYYYAATNEGLKRALITSANLTDFRNWQSVGLMGGGVVRMVTSLSNNTIALKNDSIFLVNGNTSTLIYTDAAWPVVSINSTENKLLVTQRTASGASRVLVLNANGSVEKTLVQPGVISFPRWATRKDEAVWVADFFGGLSKFDGGVERYIPDGPLGNASGEMVVNSEALYIAAGEVNEAWNYTFNRNGIYKFYGGNWSTNNAFNTPALDTVLDFITVAIDPRDESLWAGSYGGGLVNFTPQNTIKIYKQNSSLQPAVGDPTSYRVSGLAFDNNNNLWISNYGAAQNLHVRKADGTFKSFSIPYFHFENAVSQIVVDDANQIWIVSPRNNGVFVYNPGANIDALNDDKWKYFRLGTGNGNLPSNEVFSLAKDKNGFIWVGTAAGVGVVQCPEQVFETGGCEAILPVVQQDQFAGFLFQNEEVRTIAVDGANRKWIGTRNGLWLISADGDKMIYRFTEDNSPLLSNDIKKIAIDPKSGEVFISTFRGICSFRSTATDAQVNDSKILVFPNPVPPGYNGTIAIRGVFNNATVKIAELNGRLVFQTRALGGQAIWNGRNYKGEKIASGVYLVLVKDDFGVERQVSKIVIVGGR